MFWEKPVSKPSLLDHGVETNVVKFPVADASSAKRCDREFLEQGPEKKKRNRFLRFSPSQGRHSLHSRLERLYLLLFWDEATSFKRATFVSAWFVYRLVYSLLFLLVLRGMCVFRTCPQARKHAINNVFLRCLFLQFLAVHFYPGIKSLNVPFFFFFLLRPPGPFASLWLLELEVQRERRRNNLAIFGETFSLPDFENDVMSENQQRARQIAHVVPKLFFPQLKTLPSINLNQPGPGLYSRHRISMTTINVLM